MSQIKNVLAIFLSKLFGLIIFLVILGLLNFLVPYVHEVIFSEIVLFLNTNLLLILLFSLFFMISEMFFALIFPFNLPAPLFSSFGSVFLVTFIFNILNFINLNFKIGLSNFLNDFYFFAIIIVFFFVFVIGYAIIFSNCVNDLKRFDKRKVHRIKERKINHRESRKKFKKIPNKKMSIREVSDEIKK